MTIDEIRNAKAQAEAAVYKVLRQLEEETGLCVAHVAAETADITEVGALHRKTQVTRVAVRLELGLD